MNALQPFSSLGDATEATLLRCCTQPREGGITVQKFEALSTFTKDDLKLIVGALSAYQHNTGYRTLLEKMQRHQIAARKSPEKSTVLVAVR